MSSPIEVTFVLKFGEYTEVVRHNLLRQSGIILALCFISLWIISPPLAWCLAIFLRNPGSPEVSFAISNLWPSAVGILVLGLIFGLLPVLSVRAINPANRFKEQYYRFTEECIESRYATGESKFDWRTWIKFRETGRHFLLYLQGNIFHIIPKRAFASAQELEAFRDLLRRKIASA